MIIYYESGKNFVSWLAPDIIYAYPVVEGKIIYDGLFDECIRKNEPLVHAYPMTVHSGTFCLTLNQRHKHVLDETRLINICTRLNGAVASFKDINSHHIQNWSRCLRAAGDVFMQRSGRLIWLSKADQKHFTKIDDKEAK